MTEIYLNLQGVTPFIKKDINEYQEKVNNIHKKMHDKNKYKKNLGWLNLPNEIEESYLDEIIKTAEKIKSENEVFLVIGVGGSFLGARAGIEFLLKHFEDKDVEIIFAGHNLSGPYTQRLYNYLKDKDFSINVISKSGTTTEPAIAFRIFRNLLVEKYGEKANERIYVTTDPKKGYLIKQAKEKKYKTYYIPQDIGGRYSVLTAVGLLPFAVAGHNIKEIIRGSQDMYNNFLNPNLEKNYAYQYAVVRNMLYQEGKKIEILSSYEPNFKCFTEWWKQLFAESEGKNNKGIFVSGSRYPTDLHSIGQYIQDGERHLFETIIKVNNVLEDMTIEYETNNEDGINYLANKTISYVNSKALEGSMIAHISGGVPNFLIEIDQMDEYAFGSLVYFFQLACAMSAQLLGVNPFDQPGVEEYKKNMFSLLGKKGYEDILK